MERFSARLCHSRFQPFLYVTQQTAKKLKRERERDPLNKNKWIETFPRQLKQCVRKERDGFTLPKETLPMSSVVLSNALFAKS